MAPPRQAENKALIVAAAAITAAGLALASTYVYSAATRWRRCRAVLKPYEEIMLLTKERMEALKRDFHEQIQAGLEGRESSLLMLPSMVDVLPAGHETGDFYALDLGGTNFRTLYVKLSDDHGHVDDFKLENFPIPEEYFGAPIEELFDLLGKTFADFASRVNKSNDKDALHLGFCFSFPVEQKEIDRGKIVLMTKKFTNPGAPGSDPAQLLQEACERAGTKVQVRVLLNDSVGTLAGGRYSDSNVIMGIILGTGTNGCYVEKIANIKKLSAEHSRDPNGAMVVNTEWGGYVSPLLPMTADDFASDADGANPGKCHFEKLISGMFMGEAVRRILLNLAENAKLFNGHIPAKLRQPWHLTTPDIAMMDEDTSLGLTVVAERLAKVFDLMPSQCPYTARQQVKHACWLVANRSARLLAVAVAAFLEHTGRTDPVLPTTISVDGGVFEHYLAFRKYLITALGWLIGRQNVHLVQFNQFRESSSRGAAYLAAAVHHHSEVSIG